MLNVADVNLSAWSAASGRQTGTARYRLLPPAYADALRPTRGTSGGGGVEQRVGGIGPTSVSQEFREIFGGRTREALCGAGQLIVRQLGGGRQGRRAWVHASQV